MAASALEAQDWLLSVCLRAFFSWRRCCDLFLGGAAGWGFQFGGFEAFGGFPEALEFVVAAGLFGEDVDYEVYVIEQDPFGLAVAFRVCGVKAGALQAEFDFVGDGLDLARIGAAADNEVVGESSGTLFKLEDGDLFGLFFLTGGDGFGDLAAGFVGLHEIGCWS